MWLEGGHDPVQRIGLGARVVRCGPDYAGARWLVRKQPGNRGGKLYVIDLGSRNGTYLNGRPLPKREEAPLKPGDTILFGSTAEATVIAVEQDS